MAEKIKTNRSWVPGLLSFLLPLALLCAIFAALQITPFGNNSLLFGDADAYYINYMVYAREIYQGEHGLLYSFAKGAGGSLVGLEWGWLLTPYTWMLCLAGWAHIPEVFTLSVLLMTALCGATMYALLRDMSGGRRTDLLFSTVYALMGFNIVNNYNINFLIGPMMLPLVVLGIRRIRRGGSPLLYILSLAWPILTDIQMGFINCWASVLFFLCGMYVEREQPAAHRKRIWGRYCLSSLIGGLLPAVVWLPNLLSMIGGRASQTELSDFAFVEEFPFWDMGARLFTGAASTEQLIDGLPVIFCGILPVALAVLFFMDRGIDGRKKRAAGFFLGFLLLSFYIRAFSTVLHGMTHTNWFNYRFSYVFSLLVLLLAAEEWGRLDSIPLKSLRRCGGIVLAATLLIFSKQYDFVSGANAMLDLALLAGMGLCVWFYRTRPEKASRTTLFLLLAICTFFQLYLNGYISERNILDNWGDTRDAFQTELDKRYPIIDEIKSMDADFYRMENENPRTKNDPMLFDYNGISQGSHNERLFVLQNMGKLGASFDGAMLNWYDAGVPASMDALLGIRYVLSEREDIAQEKNYTLEMSRSDTYIYENPYALPLAILSDGEIAEVSIEGNADVFELQNRIWKAMTGETEDLFTAAENVTFSSHNAQDPYTLTPGDADTVDPFIWQGLSSAYIEYSFVAERSGPVYVYDAEAVEPDHGTDKDVLQLVGYFEKGDAVEGRLYFEDNITQGTLVDAVPGIFLCYANMDALARYSALLRARDVTIQMDDDAHLSGDVTAQEGQRLFLTIPYDEGWRLTVDGQDTPLDKTIDTFMSAQLAPGQHHYELRFVPVGLLPGLCLSLLALMGLICLAVITRARRPAGAPAGALTVCFSSKTVV